MTLLAIPSPSPMPRTWTMSPCQGGITPPNLWTVGLAAAATLRRALPGATVRVLEARERIGGRILTAHLPLNVDGETGATAQAAISGRIVSAESMGGGGGGGGAQPLSAQGPAAVAKAGSCTVDLGAAYVHGCNETNSVWRLAACTGKPLDTTAGGYSSGWGEECLWRNKSGEIVSKAAVRRAFKVRLHGPFLSCRFN